MKKTLRILALALCLLMLSSCGLAEITDSALNAIGSLPIVKEDITLTVAYKSTSLVIDYDTNYHINELREKSGINIEMVLFPENDAETKLMLMVNGGSKLPDILCFGQNYREQLAEAGVLLPLDDYFDKETGIADQFYARCEKENIDPQYMLNMIRCTDGHIYGVPDILYNMINMYNVRAWINQDWLDALNLKMPTTIDELTEVLIAFRDGDPNGNGIKDEIPMSGADANKMTDNNNAMVWLQNMFIFRDRKTNSFLPLNQTDGKLDVCYDKDEYREFLKYVNMLVKEGLLDRAAFTQSNGELRAQLQADTQTIGMMFGSADRFGQNIGSWTPIEQPEGFYGQRIISMNKPEPSAKLMITKDCEHPEVAFLFAMMGYDDYDLGDHYWYYAGRYGEMGVDWCYADENDQSIFKELDLKPSIRELNVLWGVENNKVLNNFVLAYISTQMETTVIAYNGTDVGSDRLNAMAVSKNLQYTPNVNDLVGTILYTNEENAEWADIRSTLQSYLIEASALFAVGQMDPYSDEDWNNYLNELNVLQYKDLIAIDQIAYNRTMGIEE